MIYNDCFYLVVFEFHSHAAKYFHHIHISSIRSHVHAIVFYSHLRIIYPHHRLVCTFFLIFFQLRITRLSGCPTLAIPWRHTTETWNNASVIALDGQTEYMMNTHDTSFSRQKLYTNRVRPRVYCRLATHNSHTIFFRSSIACKGR